MKSQIIVKSNIFDEINNYMSTVRGQDGVLELAVGM